MPTAAPSRSRSSAKSRQARRSDKTSPDALDRYWMASQSPLTALLFILPLLILHEIGVRQFGTLPGGVIEYRITAFTLLNRFLHGCGASGRYLPAMAVVAILLSWHIAKGGRWVFNSGILPLMAVESLLWASPLLGIYFVFSPHEPVFQSGGDWKLMASLYLGAGVYEELIFRLAAFAVLSLVLIDILRMPRKLATPLIVLTAAVGFSAYHILGTAHFPWQAFVFIALRGVHYGIIFLERGFGLTVGVHTAYDLMFLTLREVNFH